MNGVHPAVVGQPCGDAAEASLHQLLQGPRVRVETYGVCRARRLLSALFIGPDNLNLARITAGLAGVCPGSALVDPYQPRHEAAEAATRAWSCGASIHPGERRLHPLLSYRMSGLRHF